MLLLLLPIAWLAVVIVVVAACQAAARGDAHHPGADEDAPEAIGAGLVVWEGSAAEALREHHRPSLPSAARGRALGRMRVEPRRRRISHGIR